MKNIRRFAIASVALALGLPAVAQNADTATTAPNGQNPAQAAPARTVHNTGSAKAVLAPYGSYITQTGVGSGGADVSEIELGYNTFGFGMQGGTINNRLCDDFVVPAGQSWAVTAYKWLTYQTNAPTTGTITGMNMNIWTTDPNGQAPGGQAFSGPAFPGGSLQSSVWTGVYRVTSGTLTSTARAIIEVTNDASWAANLGAGTYWLDCEAEGSLSSGPWGPVVVPWQSAHNGLQSIAGGPFAPVQDGVSLTTQDFLFQVEGSGGGGVGSFCTSKPSSIPGCVPTLSGPSAAVSKSGAPAYNTVASPVPGGGGKPGILIYTKNGLLANPANTAFGFLCLNQFLRAGAFPAVPGGVAGNCDGSYNFNLATIMAAAPAIAAGDTIHVQAWYRDPTNPGTANFTNGIGPISVTP